MLRGQKDNRNFLSFFNSFFTLCLAAAYASFHNSLSLPADRRLCKIVRYGHISIMRSGCRIWFLLKLVFFTLQQKSSAIRGLARAPPGTEFEVGTERISIVFGYNET